MTREELFRECRRKLIKMREEKLNQVRQTQQESVSESVPMSDESDLAKLEQDQHLRNQQQKRVQEMLVEIDAALDRLDVGTYGICEETEEEIERHRLLALPWTRLSIEGAEIREKANKRFSRIA